MLHMQEMMASHDALIDSLMASQVVDQNNPDFGGFLRGGFMYVEPR